MRQKLLSKDRTDPDGRKRILITTEEFTTQQHPMNQGLHGKIEGIKTWDKDGFTSMRDNVGAYNIFLRTWLKNEVENKKLLINRWPLILGGGRSKT